MSWLDVIRRWLGQKQPARSPKSGRAAHALPMVLGQLEATRDVEYSCDDVHAVLDRFTELVASGGDAAGLMPLVRYHLDHCPDCREEFEALLRVLRAGA